jgi:hypothetical protein
MWLIVQEDFIPLDFLSGLNHSLCLILKKTEYIL